MSSPGTPEALIEIDAEDWTRAAFHGATEVEDRLPICRCLKCLVLIELYHGVPPKW